ncbi:DUF2569 domain-containing protein [Pontiellaceae bacterium B12219]|nr:DUF2569 domain-containing protein [Pontiellaceae bacterium B12219]
MNPFQEDLRGIKGWLILIAIGVVISPLRIIGGFVLTFAPIFTQGTWKVLVTPGTEAYNPMWVPLLAFEITYNLAMSIAAVFLVILFFRQHRFFPRLYIVMMALPLLVLPLDSWLITFIMPENPVFDESTVQELAKGAIGAVIWIPYMLKSKRVKATFIRGTAPKSINPQPGDQ